MELVKKNPLIIKEPYNIDYRISYGELSPFFKGLAQKKIKGTQCKKCKKTYATPRMHCMDCGSSCKWVDLPKTGKVHSWTICHYASESFLDQVPFTLVLVEFRGCDTLFMSRLEGVKQKDMKIGMKVKAQFAEKPEYKVSDVWFVKA